MPQSRNREEASRLLRQFLSAGTERSADEALETLLVRCVEPTIRSTLGTKLRITAPGSSATRESLDALELISDVEAKVIKELRARRAGESVKEELSSLGAYVRTVTLNRFRQYIRERYPERFRLKNKIIYIIHRTPGIDIWLDGSGRRVAGLSETKEDEAGRLATASRSEIENLVESHLEGHIDLDDNGALVPFVRSVVADCKVPADLDALTSSIARAIGLRETAASTGSESLMPELTSKEADLRSLFDTRVELASLWKFIGDLTPDQRKAVLLNLRGSRGENALAYLPIIQVASVSEIAAVLEMSVDELAAIWPQLPLDDKSIAERLSVSRQKVINLRQSARKKLRDRQGR